MTDDELKICERFKEIRMSLNMKQGDFAKEIKTTQGHVSDIENKRKGVSDRVIEIICLKYNINKKWLLKGEGEMMNNIDIAFGDICAYIGAHDPKAKEAITKYYELTDSDKELWWKYMERFSKF